MPAVSTTMTRVSESMDYMFTFHAMSHCRQQLIGLSMRYEARFNETKLKNVIDKYRVL